MERYYCENCRLLYDEVKTCPKCGLPAEKKIWIEVQKQPDGK